MDRRDYLPKAVAHKASELELMDDFTLMRHQVECLEWLLQTGDFRCQVSTPTAVVVWNALIELEIAMVAAAEARIDEIRRARRS